MSKIRQGHVFFTPKDRRVYVAQTGSRATRTVLRELFGSDTISGPVDRVHESLRDGILEDLGHPGEPTSPGLWMAVRDGVLRADDAAGRREAVRTAWQREGAYGPTRGNDKDGRRWAAALERVAARHESYPEDRTAIAEAERIRWALAVGVRNEHDARLVLAALGYANPDAVERVLFGDDEPEDMAIDAVGLCGAPGCRNADVGQRMMPEGRCAECGALLTEIGAIAQIDP